MQDDGEPGIAGIEILLIKDGLIVAEQISDDNGNYGFFSIEPGEYFLQFTYDVSLSATISVDSADLNSDIIFEENDGNAKVAVTADFEIDVCEQNFSIDLGLTREIDESIIGDYVWNDGNQNGRQDPAEIGIDGIKIFLSILPAQAIPSFIWVFLGFLSFCLL